jgi:DNA-binding transcriptional ArsR family regulator
VTRRIGADAARDHTAFRRKERTHLLYLLIWLRPAELSAEGFLRWLGALSAGEMYEVLAPRLRDDDLPRLRELTESLPRYVEMLTLWHERYFRHLDPAILSGLAASAAAWRERIQTTPPDELVEEATNGVRLTLDPAPEVVLLTPQYHYRPWNLFSWYRGVYLVQYPADVLPPAPGEPPPALLRLTRALADESRLRILRLLVHEPLTFTELVRRIGLSKSTVHHHMVALRASGLVRVHTENENTTTYSLRASAIEALGSRLTTFLTAE